MEYWANALTDSQTDYRKLRELLSNQKYKEADEETRQLFLEILGKGRRTSPVMKWFYTSLQNEVKDYLKPEDFEKIPCIDLRIIDQLWLDYSNRKYGFSVQRQTLDAKKLGWCGLKKYIIEESQSYYREDKTQLQQLNDIDGQPIIARYETSEHTWFSEDSDYFAPPSYLKPRGFYPYKPFVYLNEYKKQVTIDKQINTWGNLGWAVLDTITGKKEFSVNKFKITILDFYGKQSPYFSKYENSIVDNIKKCFERCGICPCCN